MEWLVIFVAAIWLFRRTARLGGALEEALGRLKEAESRIRNLEGRIAAGSAAAPGVSVPAAAATPVEVPEPEAAVEAGLAAVEPGPVTAPVPAPAVAIARAEPARAPRRWSRIETAFVENWTGILGAVVVVAGITFVGIYTAIRLPPFQRFLMVVAAAAVLAGASGWLRRQPSWQTLAEWVRSASAAVFLFACAASGGLTGLGMQWIDSPPQALAVLSIGVAVNVALAWRASAQSFAALHLVLSIVPLVIVPPSDVALGIASAVALAGAGLAFRRHWEGHLAAVIATYLGFHVLWHLAKGQGGGEGLPGAWAVLNAVAVFSAGALVHYRTGYSVRTVAATPLVAHLGNWALLAFALLAYPVAPTARSAALAAAGIAAFLLARRMRGLGVRWLHLADTLIGQSLVLAAIASLNAVIADLQLTLLAAFLECLLFIRVVVAEDDSLFRIGWLVAHVAGGVLAMHGVATLNEVPALPRQGIAVLLAGAGASAGFLAVLDRRHGPRLQALVGSLLPLGSLAWLGCLLVFVAMLNLLDSAWRETVSSCAIAALLLLARAFSPPGLRPGAATLVAAAHLVSWPLLFLDAPWQPAALAQHLGPLAALAAASAWISRPGIPRRLGTYLAGADLALAAYLFLEPVSSLLPGVTWLLLSLVAAELLLRLEPPEAVDLAVIGYGLLLAFAGAYALVILQTPAYVGPVPARALIEAFALAVIGYWWYLEPGRALADHPAWRLVHPYFLEFALLAAAVVIGVEVRYQWQAIAWALLAHALRLPALASRIAPRLALYSLLFYWMSVVQVPAGMGAFESPSPQWFDRPDVAALLAIALQVAYLVNARSALALSDVPCPAGIGALGRMGNIVMQRSNLWIYYPFFAGVALFLLSRFDRSVLTLLWSAEAFVVFVLSAVLRENPFRYVALAALALCLGRLLLVDMAEANLGLRGAVFIGVGLLMLGMNAIYNRYRARFQ